MPNLNINRRVILNKYQLQPETIEWLSVLTTPPSPTVINSVNQFIGQCKVDGNWQYLDRFWLFAQDNQANTRISIKNPTSTAITEVNSPTWTQFQGYTGNGANMYLNTNYTPSISGVNYTLNSACFGLYNRTDGALGTYEMGCVNAANTNYNALNVKWSDNKSYWIINNNTNFGSVVAGSALGHYKIARTDVNATNINVNGSEIGTTNVVSSALCTVPFFILCYNINGVAGTFTTRQISLAYIGGGSIGSTKMNNAIQTLAYQLKFNV